MECRVVQRDFSLCSGLLLRSDVDSVVDILSLQTAIAVPTLSAAIRILGLQKRARIIGLSKQNK